MARALPGLPPPRPIPHKEHSSTLFVEKRRLDVLDGALVVVGNTAGARTSQSATSPASCWRPGARISHAAAALAARAGTPVAWGGEAGVHLHAAGQPCGARSERLLFQSAPRPRRERAAESRAKNVFDALWRRRSRATFRRAVARHWTAHGSSGSVSFMRVKMP